MAAKAKRQTDQGLKDLSYSQAQEQLEQALAQLQSTLCPWRSCPSCTPKPWHSRTIAAKNWSR